MNIYRLPCLLFCFFSLSACVFLDIACQDTAVPLHPKKINASLHLTNAVNISHTYYENTVEDPEPNRIPQTPLLGTKALIGISPEADLVLNLACGSGTSRISLFDSSTTSTTTRWESFHLKLGVKYLLSQKGKSYVSVLPSLYLANALDSGTRWSNQDYKFKYNAKGIEGQLLITHLASKHFNATLAGRIQANHVQKILDGERYGPHFTANYGIRGNVQISAGPIYLMPEFGMELMPIVNGSSDIVPIVSLGFGVSL